MNSTSNLLMTTLLIASFALSSLAMIGSHLAEPATGYGNDITLAAADSFIVK